MKKNSTSRKSGTDLERLDAMTDADIDLSDIPEVTPEMFAKGIVRRGLKPIAKRQITLRLDSDVIEWFKGQEEGYRRSHPQRSRHILEHAAFRLKITIGCNREQRKPTLLFVFVGSFLLRLAERTLLSLLFHAPLRSTPPASLHEQAEA